MNIYNKKNNLPWLLILIIIMLQVSACNKSKQQGQKPAANCLSSGLQTGVIAFYPFSNGSVNDFSGNSYNLTNTSTAAPATDRAGNSNCAFGFSSSASDFLKYPNPTFIDNFQTLPFSISLWYKNLTTTAPNYEILIGRDTFPHCPDTYGQWSVGLYDLRKPVLGINEYSLWWNNATMPDTLWKHLVVTCQNTDLKLYLNGVLTSETPGTGCTVNVPTLNAGDLVIGKYYTGLLDDIIIYNRILSQSEITELYNTQACCQ